MGIITIVLVFLVVWITVDLNIGTRLHQSRIKKQAPAKIRQCDIHFFSQGDKLFDHMLQHLDKAKHQIHMQFYIFRDDNIGTKFLDLLKKKASEGVQVKLLVDWAGYKISKKAKVSLKKAGVELAKTNTPSFPFLFYSIHQRNHRKVTIIDGAHSYIGGYNIGDEYLGRDEKMGRWRDYHLCIEGAASEDLQQQFLIDWNGASETQHEMGDIKQKPIRPGDIPIQIIPSDGSHIINSIHDMLDRAENSIFIGTPYFIPSESVKNKLVKLAEAGVNVKVLVPKYPDHPLVKDAGYPYFSELIKAGADIRQFYQGFYHSKIIIIDDRLMDIGTSNFDKRSFHVNNEINCIIDKQSWVAPSKKEVEKDFYESAEKITLKDIENRSVLEKLKEKVATLLSPFL
ncbi:cardiolipin synthase [Salipaludibacillus sp. HK11]|uniref:cardiolipin synthase n=1 Tax=Salipaludibacillus sp. HK11 TaxID=3394320 RepID=UPI0039FBA94B